MNRKKATELWPIIKAFSEGRAIQVKDNNIWKDVDDIQLNLKLLKNLRSHLKIRLRSLKQSFQQWVKLKLSSSIRKTYIVQR
jgi:hypothetical protein